MGSVESYTRPAPVTLIPPQFQRERNTRRQLTKTPFEYLFCEKEMKRLFHKFLMEEEGMNIGIYMRPDDLLNDASVPEDDVSVKGRLYLPTSEGTSTGVAGAQGSLGMLWRNVRKGTNDPVEFLSFLYASENSPLFKLQGCYFNPVLCAGAFGTCSNSKPSCIGLRYSSHASSVGVKLDRSLGATSLARGPVTSWWVGRRSNLLCGVQCEVQDTQLPLRLSNWQCGLAYRRSTPTVDRSAFELALQVRDMGQSVVISYFHHLVVKRSVRNPFEKQHVRHITNYLDVGFQILNRRVMEKFVCSMVTAGASWQLNKNWLVKLRANFSSIAGALVFKSWWTPSVTFSLSCKYSLQSRKTSYGCSIFLENFGDVTYQKAAAHQEVPTKWEYGMTEREEAKERRAQQMPRDKREVTERDRQAVTVPPSENTYL